MMSCSFALLVLGWAGVRIEERMEQVEWNVVKAENPETCSRIFVGDIK